MSIRHQKRRQPRPGWAGAVGRAPCRALRVLHALLAVVAAATGHVAVSCSVPVFRYALERWAPDPYIAVVFHRGPLTAEQAGWLRDLGPAGKPGMANVVLRTVDVSGLSDDALLPAWRDELAASTLPVLALLYPPAVGNPAPAWHAPLTDANVRRLLDSPLRREIAGRLLGGECAVWVLLESGDEKLDTAAAAVLGRRLKHLQATLTLPEPDPADLAAGAETAARENLRVRFSIARLARTLDAEAALTGMLTHTEDDLAGARQPIAFPIFGRGRVLYALVGEGINDATIDEACRFVTGACSCVIKEENPGTDLLMAVDWAALVQPMIKSDAAPPPLGGIAGFVTAKISAAPGAPPGATRADYAEAAGTGGMGRVVRRLALVGSVGGGLLLGATWWLLRRRGGG